MKKTITILLVCLLTTVASMAQTGTWRAYMAYKDVQQIVKANNRLFVRASNDLYSYGLDDHSITTYDNIRQLSDSYITRIAWNKDAGRLIVVYQNANIDIIDGNDEVTNISSLYLKSMTQDKTVNSVYVYGAFAYLATNFGVAKVNMRQAIITESYILNTAISRLGIVNGVLYALKADGGYLQAKLTKNLINPSNWESTATVPDGIFDEDLTDWNEYHELVATLNPGGPYWNHFYSMRFKHGRLYTVGGCYNCVADMNRPGIVQILNDGEWTILPSDISVDWNYRDADAIDVDPNDPDHIAVMSKSGVYEFQGTTLKNAWNLHNSPIRSALPLKTTETTDKNYTLALGGTYDAKGNLWVLNSLAPNSSILCLGKDGQWTTHHQQQLVYDDRSFQGMLGMMADSRGLLWFVNFHWNVPAFIAYDPDKDQIVQKITTLTNQDGQTITQDFSAYCVAEDRNGNIWLGSNEGPLLLEQDRLTDEDVQVTQVKVPRNDGSDLADYLLSGVIIRAIAIDDGNRKWFGTQGSGLYLISSDNISQLEHFTTDNSPLLSDNIESLAWNPETGELFIGTDQGLCSYMTDATASIDDMSDESVYAFPNPVPSSYQGIITVRGLSTDSDVKVVTTSGRLVAQGRSNGGTFTWDGRDRQGRRVASGIYMIVTAKSNGDKGCVGKIAILK